MTEATTSTTPLIDAVKKARIQAVKDKDEVKKSVLVTLIGDAERKAKDEKRQATDEDFVKAMKRLLTSIEDNFKIFAAYPVTKAEDIEKRKKDEAEKNQEKAILLELMPAMPAQMTEDELRAEMVKIKTALSLDAKGMGAMMKEVKSRFVGKYDGGMASKVAKEVLA